MLRHIQAVAASWFRALFLAFVVAAIAAPVIASFAIGIQQGIHAPPYVATILTIAFAGFIVAGIMMAIASTDPRQAKKAPRTRRFDFNFLNIQAVKALVTYCAGIRSNGASARGRSRRAFDSVSFLFAFIVAASAMSAAMAMGWAFGFTLIPAAIAFGMIILAIDGFTVAARVITNMRSWFSSSFASTTLLAA